MKILTCVKNIETVKQLFSHSFGVLGKFTNSLEMKIMMKESSSI